MSKKTHSTSSSASNPTSYRKNLIRSDKFRETKAIVEAIAKFGDGHKD